MTILLTGATGFVGSHLKKRLEADGHVVVYPDRQSLQLLSSDRLRYDAIINCAAELTDETKMHSSNYVLVEHLLDFARDKGIGKFIQIGSSSEYGATNEIRCEDTWCNPTNLYESTKLAASTECLVRAQKHDIDICVARPFSLYGDGDKPRKLIPMLYRSYLDHASINLFAGSHDWIFIDDFLDGLMLLLAAPRSVTKGEIFNFGSGVCSSNDQVVAGLEKALGGSLNIIKQNGRYHAHDVDNWVADISKSKRLLNWTPKWSLDAGLKEYVMREWFAQDKSGQGT